MKVKRVSSLFLCTAYFVAVMNSTQSNEQVCKVLMVQKRSLIITIRVIIIINIIIRLHVAFGMWFSTISSGCRPNEILKQGRKWRRNLPKYKQWLNIIMLISNNAWIMLPWKNFLLAMWTATVNFFSLFSFA